MKRNLTVPWDATLLYDHIEFVAQDLFIAVEVEYLNGEIFGYEIGGYARKIPFGFEYQLFPPEVCAKIEAHIRQNREAFFEAIRDHGV